MKANPGTPLPRDIGKIMEITGCTKDQVTTFLYRQRKKVKQDLAQVPDLRKLPIVVRVDDGRDFPMKECLAYTFVIDHWSAKASIRIETKEGILGAKIPNVRQFVETVQSMYGTESSESKAP